MRTKETEVAEALAKAIADGNDRVAAADAAPTPAPTLGWIFFLLLSCFLCFVICLFMLSFLLIVPKCQGAFRSLAIQVYWFIGYLASWPH